MPKYRILDTNNKVLHEGEYRSVHTTSYGQADGARILWVSHIPNGVIIAVRNVTVLASSGDTLWIGRGPYCPGEPSKVVWPAEAEQPNED